MRTPAFILLAILVSAATGCAALQSPEAVDEPALIIFYADTATITAPARVARGTSFEVRVRTFGGGCTRQIARTDVRVEGSVVEIRPFNRRITAEVCTADLLFLDHVATASIDAPGSATIRVIGEQRGPDTGDRNVDARLERPIVVE